jgi:hypothetical protein
MTQKEEKRSEQDTIVTKKLIKPQQVIGHVSSGRKVNL